MQINRTTGAILIGFLAILGALALWGPHLHLDGWALDGVRYAATAIGGILLALAGPLLRRDENRDGIPDVLQVLVLGVVLPFLAAGCGGAQAAVSAQAAVVVATQPDRFAFYQEQDARCAASADRPAWDRCMAPAIEIQRAADAYRRALEAAQDLIRAGAPEESIARRIACLAAAAVAFVAALAAAGVPVPPEVRDVAALVPEEACS